MFKRIINVNRLRGWIKVEFFKDGIQPLNYYSTPKCDLHGYGGGI